jgi:hypothetical protein
MPEYDDERYQKEIMEEFELGHRPTEYDGHRIIALSNAMIADAIRNGFADLVEAVDPRNHR